MAAEFSTDKQAVTHFWDIVYGHDTAGRHLIVGLDEAMVYGHLLWSADTYIGLRTGLLTGPPIVY